MVGNNAVPWRNKPLPLHAPTCLATFRQKKLEVARKKTMPIGIRNHANLIRFEGGRYRNHRTTVTGSNSSARDSDGVRAIYPAKSFGRSSARVAEENFANGCVSCQRRYCRRLDHPIKPRVAWEPAPCGAIISGRRSSKPEVRSRPWRKSRARGFLSSSRSW